MMLDGNIIPISVLGGRVIDSENRIPLFLLTLYRTRAAFPAPDPTCA